MDQLTLKATRQKFDEEGFTVFNNVLDNDLMQEAKEHIDWLIAKNPGVRPERLGTAFVKDDPFWIRLVSDDRLLDIAEQFIGPNIALFASHYISKPAYDGRPVLWHQDGSYWPLEPMEVVTLWLAVDDSLLENGCMRVIPRTQTMNLQEHKKNLQVESVLETEVDPSLVDESKAVDLVLKSGSVSVHHPNVIHGSKANHSPLRRCGLTIRYIPTSTKIITDKQWHCAFLLRGEAVPGVNEYLPKPKYVEGQHIRFRGSESWV